MKIQDDWWQEGYQQGESDEQDRIVALILDSTKNLGGSVVWDTTPEQLINDICEGKR